MMRVHEENDVLKIAIEDRSDDYVILNEPEVVVGDGGGGGGVGFWYWLWWWLKLVLVMVFLGVLGVCFFLWIGPFLMNKEVIPILNWETETFCKPVLAVLIFATVALFPTIFLPSTPSMWVAGMSFGYGFGFLLIIGGVTIGVSLPYFLGSLFYHKIQGWLERYPKKASILKLAGEGNWFNQFRAVTLLRISPFPYIIYNYCAVAADVKFGPYLFGTLLGMIPKIFVAIYMGIMIRTLADASNDHHSLSAPQIICTVFGFYGAKATMNVWEPKIQQPNEFTMSQIWILGGSFGEDLNSIEAGWQVSPGLYGDNNTRLFTYWTSDAYQATGCYNLLCSGFIQINNIAMGASIFSVSAYRNAQYDISILAWKVTSKFNPLTSVWASMGH